MDQIVDFKNNWIDNTDNSSLQVCQGAKTEMVEELVLRGSDIDAVDNAGLPLTSAAKLLKNRQ